MIKINKVILIGRVANNLELRTTTNNTSVSKFSVAVNQGYGEDKKVDFINCIAWRKQAENLCKYCVKGSKVAIEGKLQSYSYEDSSGDKKYGMQVIADNITFLDSKKGNESEEEFSKSSVNSEEESVSSIYTDDIEIEDDDIPWMKEE